MPRNRARIDADLVQKTQYNVPPNKTAKTPPPKPWPLPHFEPLYIDNQDDHGSPNLPSDVDQHDPYELFSLFFTEDIINKLIEWTNKYIELYLLYKETEYACLQQLIYKEELYAYFNIFIYIGITIKLYIKDYWKDLNTYSTKHIIKKYILII